MRASKFKGFYIIEDFMVNELGLGGTKLLLFAAIYSFSRKGKACNGSLEYLADAVKCTKQTAINNLKALEKDGLIYKQQTRDADGGLRNHYGVNLAALQEKCCFPQIVEMNCGKPVETVENQTERSNFFTPPTKNFECPPVKKPECPSQKIIPNKYIGSISSSGREHGKPPSEKQEKKLTFGEFQNVYLTASEYNQLKSWYGEQLDVTLTSFSSFMHENKRTYQNHFAMLTKWCKQDLQRIRQGWKPKKAKYVSENAAAYASLVPNIEAGDCPTDYSVMAPEPCTPEWEEYMDAAFRQLHQQQKKSAAECEDSAADISKHWLQC